MTALINRRSLMIAGSLLCATAPLAHAQAHRVISLTLPTATGREARYRILVPPQAGLRPVIVFSHGANSRADLYDAMLGPICQAGFVVIAPDHLDSGGQPPAANVPPEGLWQTRVDDLAAPLAHAKTIKEALSVYGVTPDFTHVCAAGHSFGAAVAQALGGAILHFEPDTPPRALSFEGVKAVMAISPPGPRAGLVPPDAWASVTVPSVLVTGTDDVLPGFIDRWEIHAEGFEQNSAGNRWQIVGEGVDHYFGGLICRLKDDEAAVRQRPALEATNTLLIDFLRQWAEGTNIPVPSGDVPDIVDLTQF